MQYYNLNGTLKKFTFRYSAKTICSCILKFFEATALRRYGVHYKTIQPDFKNLFSGSIYKFRFYKLACIVVCKFVHLYPLLFSIRVLSVDFRFCRGYSIRF